MLFTEVKNWMQVNNHGLMLALLVTPYLVLWLNWVVRPGFMVPLYYEPYNERELRPFWVMYITPAVIVFHALLLARLPAQTGALKFITSILAVLPILLWILLGPLFVVCLGPDLVPELDKEPPRPVNQVPSILQELFRK